MIEEKPLHPEKCPVWVALSPSGIVGSILLEGTATSEFYHQMLPETESGLK